MHAGSSRPASATRAKPSACSNSGNEQIGAQTDIDVTRSRILTGSVGASEALVEMETEIEGLDDLQRFFDKISSISMHEDWGKKMGDVVVSGSTRWEVFRVID